MGRVSVLVPIAAIGMLGLSARWFGAAASPMLTGPYSVGTSPLDMAAAFAHSDRRRPRIELWYPVDSRPRDPAAPADRAPLSAAEARWPLLLYFPGWPGTEIQNRFLIHDLVTQGFVVAAVTYPLRSPPDARGEEAAPLPDLEFSSEAATKHTLQIFDRRIHEMVRDSSMVLDELTRLDAEDPGWLAHRLDFTRTGIFGFSLGGAVAVTAYWSDPRIRAAVLLDQNHWLDAPQRPDTCNLLLVSEAHMAPTPEELKSKNPYVHNAALADQFDTDKMTRQFKQYGGIRVTIPNTAHGDFSDAVLSPSLRQRVLSGISPQRKLDIIDAYVITYFRWIFLKVGQPLPENQRTRFPEVEVLDFRDSTACKAAGVPHGS